MQCLLLVWNFQFAPSGQCIGLVCLGEKEESPPLAKILPGDAEAHSAPLLYKHFQRITWILDEITMR